MELKVNQNHKGYKDLLNYSNKKGITVKEALTNDAHLDAVCTILYSHMNVAIKFVIKKEKFKTVFLAQRHELANIFDNLSKQGKK